MEVEHTDPAATGLHQLVTTLSRQREVIRQEVGSSQQLKQKKEALLQTGYNVLKQHCALASLGQNVDQYQPGTQNSYQAAVTELEPSSSGWKVSIQVQGPAELLKHTSVTIAAIVPGSGIGGCSVKQLENISRKESSTGILASAIIKLQGGPSSSRVHSSTRLEIYALLTSSSLSSTTGVVHAGKITLDSTAWLRSFQAQVEKEREQQQKKTFWPVAAHFSVEIPLESIDELDRNWIGKILVQHLGFCSSSSGTFAGAGSGGGGGQWHLGSAAQVHSPQLSINCSSTSNIVPVSIYGESMQIVWAIQEELKTRLVQEIADGGRAGQPKWIQKSSSGIDTAKTSIHSNLNTLKTSVDALIAEVDSLSAWIDVLKKQQAAGNSVLVRQEVLEYQAAAVDAMIHTDTTAIEVASTQ